MTVFKIYNLIKTIRKTIKQKKKKKRHNERTKQVDLLRKQTKILELLVTETKLKK